MNKLSDSSDLEMTRISASEFQKSFGAASDKALREPIAITKQGRDHLVVMSAEEYARLKRRDRKVHPSGSLPDDLLAAVERSTVDPRHDHLDADLQDGRS